MIRFIFPVKKRDSLRDRFSRRHNILLLLLFSSVLNGTTYRSLYYRGYFFERRR